MSNGRELSERTAAAVLGCTNPLPDDIRGRAVRQVVRAATSVQDARELLDMLGLRAEEGCSAP